MAISQDTVDDVRVAVAFTDDLRAAYSQLKAIQLKIQRYGAAVAAVAAETATPREAKFAELVQTLIEPTDIARIGALLPTVTAFCEEIEANYADFIA